MRSPILKPREIDYKEGGKSKDIPGNVMNGTTLPRRNGPATQIAILRALQLGDLLCAVPAWRALRAAFPSARISLIGLPWARQFVSRFHHYLDEFIEFPGYPGLPERSVATEAIPPFLTEMQSRRFDLVLQMQGSGHYANEVAALFGAESTAGFYVPGEWCPDPDTFTPYPDMLPEVHRHLHLMTFLGVPSLRDDMEWPVIPADEDAFMRLEESRLLMRREYVCIHPGGRGVSRRWAPEHFAGIADMMAARGFQVVVTGTQDESGLATDMARAMRTKAISMVGRTDLGALGVLLRHAKMLIANDTGVSHVAAGLRLPSVIICTDSDPVRWGPLDRQRHRVLLGAHANLESVIREIDDVLAGESVKAEVSVS
jgi:ADP-heptose:LPS heptosyltransferase